MEEGRRKMKMKTDILKGKHITSIQGDGWNSRYFDIITSNGIRYRINQREMLEIVRNCTFIIDPKENDLRRSRDFLKIKSVGSL
jgi:hypothetical protein